MEALVAFVVILLSSLSAVVYWTARTRYPLLKTRSPFGPSIPAVGREGWIGSYFDAIRFLKDPVGMIQEGHEKFPGKLFRIPLASNWIVLATHSTLVKEIGSMTDQYLSLTEASIDFLQSNYTGLPTSSDVVEMVRHHTTKTLGLMIPAMDDEIDQALSDLLQRSALDSDWSSFSAYQTLTNVAARATARVFVGPQKSCDTQYLEFTSHYAHQIIHMSMILNALPTMFKGVVNWLVNPLPRFFQCTYENVSPLINNSIRNEKSIPDDTSFLSLVIKRLKARGNADPAIIFGKLMAANFAAIHTTSATLTHAILYLAAYPEYADPLREEITGIIHEEGLTKISLDKMHKLDSFLKESMRLSPISGFSIVRKVVQDLTLANGSFLPSGTLLLVSPLPTHADESLYCDHSHFNGFRFCDQSSSTSKMSVPSLNYFPFGYGRHACPGRQMAITIMKITMAKLVLRYELKLNGARPADRWLAAVCLPGRPDVVWYKRLAQDPRDGSPSSGL